MATTGGRLAGYAAAATIGLAIGGFLGFNAFFKGMCGTWGEQCTPEETAEIERLWRRAFATPVVVVGLYAAIDLVFFANSSARRAPGRGGGEDRLQRMAAFAKQGQRGPVDGTLGTWDDASGRGSITSPEVEGEVWVHAANLAHTMPRPLRPGLPVEFTYESPGPDGYRHQAIWVRPA